jgi:hypothetical protein
MTAQEHILSTLKSLAEPVQFEDIGTTPVEDAIFAKVMSKKFRKVRADEETIRIAKNAIHTAVKNNEPVTVSFLFGGNKLWRFEEAPEIDWAEFFAVTYFLKWMKTIASVYPPGARLDFYSEDIAVETLNNVPRSEAEQYSVTFCAMLDWLKPYIPQGVTVTYRRYAEEYPDYDAYLAELETAKKQVLEANNGQLPVLSERQKAATELNVRLLPGQADDPLWREKTELIHKALEETDTMKRYFNDPTLVMACPTVYSGWIAVGSTKRSYAKFWAAVGALEKSGEGFNELVLTPQQLEAARFEWEPVVLEGLSGKVGKNFTKVRIMA